MKHSKQKLNIYEPISIIDAINCLQTFLESDLWSLFKDDEINGNVYSRDYKFKTEEELWNYLEAHFNLLRNEIKKLTLQTDGTTARLKEDSHHPDNQHPVDDLK